MGARGGRGGVGGADVALSGMGEVGGIDLCWMEGGPFFQAFGRWRARFARVVTGGGLGGITLLDVGVRVLQLGWRLRSRGSFSLGS